MYKLLLKKILIHFVCIIFLPLKILSNILCEVHNTYMYSMYILYFNYLKLSIFCLEHDDRTHSNNTRRVSFKPGTNKGKNKFRTWNDAQLLLDGDIDMGATGGPGVHRKGFRNRGGRLSSPAPRPASKKRFIPGPLPWYQIVIPYGAKHDKQVVLQALLGYLSPEVFIPHYYKINGNAAVFYVDDVKIAEQLFYADRKIVMSDGFKLVVIVRNSVPNVAIDDNMKEKMKLAMAKRYNATTKALDLTKFHADPGNSLVLCILLIIDIGKLEY